MNTVFARGAAFAGLSRLRRSAERGLRIGLDTLLPPQCPLCQTAVEQQGLLCAGCFGRIGIITPPFCACCGVPFSVAALGSLCPGCEASRPAFRTARGALRYDSQSRGLILPLKHADRLELAPVLASMMLRSGAPLLRHAEVLVPVPLHRARLFQRRYNQAAVLALLLGKRAGVPVLPDGLVRTRPTASLDDRTAEARAAEVRGAFAVRPGRAGRIAGRQVLLIDDVMTSGATADACAQALLDAGAAAVDVLVGARVPDPRLG